MNETSEYPCENYPTVHTPSALRELETRALWIAHTEGRTEVTPLDRIRAERELRLAATES
jgi:hypothetical protein